MNDREMLIYVLGLIKGNSDIQNAIDAIEEQIKKNDPIKDLKKILEEEYRDTPPRIMPIGTWSDPFVPNIPYDGSPYANWSDDHSRPYWRNPPGHILCSSSIHPTPNLDDVSVII